MPQPIVNVYQDDDDIYTIVVEHADHAQFPDARTKVDLTPNPAWPSPTEANDRIADAVRQVLDMAWESATGQPIQRRCDHGFSIYSRCPVCRP